MKRITLIMILLILLPTTSNSLAQEKSKEAVPPLASDLFTESWQTNYLRFLEELKSNRLDSAIAGKPVQWSGRVKELKSPTEIKRKDGKGVVYLTMEKPYEVKVEGHEAVTSSELTPLVSKDEWEKWKLLKANQRIVFKTRLLYRPGIGLFLVFQDPRSGKYVAGLETEEVTLVKVEKD